MDSTAFEFEEAVRRIARQLWPVAEHGGAEIIDGRERDAVFHSEEFIDCIECTTSRSKEKAVNDGKKLEGLVRKFGRNQSKFVRGWFITRDEPTADQRTVIGKFQGKIQAISFEQFRSKLIDARSYLALREKHPFGSMRNPSTGHALFSLQYVPLTIVDKGGTEYSAQDIAQEINTGKRLVLTGDYGAGKSSTSREIFLELKREYHESTSPRFPVMINLRDHHGQTEPVEVLERHARRVGFEKPSSLVRAWKAGYCTLILDGFDEIASAGWAGQTKKLKDLRYRSMELLRRIFRESPPETGILVTGRAHFFDSERELRQAIGVRANAVVLDIEEFSAEQVATFLQSFDWPGGVPDWLPSRPLLLAYLASVGLLDKETFGDAALSPAAGWDFLLDKICGREAEIEAGIDETTVRKLIEVLATTARNTIDGLGPLSPEAIQDAFRYVCGYTPDDRGAVLLQRLPGLGGVSQEDGSRVFIDRDFADVARAGDIARFIQDPFGEVVDSTGWETVLGPLGCEVAAFRCNEAGFDSGKVTAAIEKAQSDRQSVLATDLISVLSGQGGVYEGKQIYLSGVHVELLGVEENGNLSKIEYQDSLFSRLDLPADVDAGQIPTFRRCHFAQITGRTGEQDLPAEKFVDCTFDEFELSGDTTAALLGLPLPLATKVLLTVMKKIFVQKGAGRREGGLHRGLDSKARPLVRSILDLLRREGFVVATRQGSETIWLPCKDAEIRRRAFEILSGPINSTDVLLQHASAITE